MNSGFISHSVGQNNVRCTGACEVKSLRVSLFKFGSLSGCEAGCHFSSLVVECKEDLQQRKRAC